MKNMAELNDYLRTCCVEDQQRTVSGQTQTIGQRWAAERTQALAVTKHVFDACVSESRVVDKYQTMAWEKNRYSVPRREAYKTVVVKAYAERIEIVCEGRVVARHARCYGRQETILESLHYLSLLDRKPAYLDHTDVYRNWRLPLEFTELRVQLEARQERGPPRSKHSSNYFSFSLLL